MVSDGSTVTGAAPAGPEPGSLLERERELRTIEALVGAARTGTGGVVLIEGEAGVGKTRLLVSLRDQAQGSGLPVLSARAGELEGDFPYGVVRQLFEPLLARQGDGLLAGPAAAATAVFDSVPDASPADDASFAALHGLYWLVVNLTADGPFVLCVDDLHWVDIPSLRFLAYLVRRLEDLPVLLGATLRSSEPGTDPASLAEIAHDSATVAIRPRNLSAGAVTALARERLGGEATEEFGAACHRATSGNPLILRQLLRTLEAEGVRPDAANVDAVRDIGPRAVSRSVLLRLARLEAPAADVARAVAILGDSATLPTVSSLIGLPEDPVAEAAGALARAEILRSEPPMGFVHPLVRYAIYHELPAAERELLHGRAARMLAEAGAAPDQVANQLLSAPRRGEAWVIETLRAAGYAALRRGAPESATTVLRRALDEPPSAADRPWVLLELGMAELLVDSVAAAEHLAEARDTLPDPAAAGRAAHLLARTLLFTAPPDDAARAAADALARLPVREDDLGSALEAIECFAVFFGAEPQDRLDRLVPHRDTEAAGTIGGRMLQAAALWDWTQRSGTADECARMALDLLADDLLFEGDDGLFLAAAILPLGFADRDEGLEAWERVRRKVHQRGSLFGAITVAHWRGVTLLLRGELADAEESLSEAARAFGRWRSQGRSNAWMLAFLARVQLEQGRIADARGTLGSVDRDIGSDSDTYWMTAHVELLLAERRFDEALAAAEEMAAAMVYTANPALAPWRSLKALALDGLGRTGEAIDLLHGELDLARNWGAPGTLGRTLRILGTLERAEGHPRLAEAVAVLEGSPARLEHAKALAALGAAVRRDRRPTEAREPLRRALELASACGAEPLVEAVRRELYASGARPRTDALSGVEALTSSERRVADLAAEGHTNRDIAQILFVTPKTVEVHLSSAYRKLGIGSRRELPAALAPRG